MTEHHTDKKTKSPKPVSRARVMAALRLTYRVTAMPEKDFLAYVDTIDKKYPSQRDIINLPKKL